MLRFKSLDSLNFKLVEAKTHDNIMINDFTDDREKSNIKYYVELEQKKKNKPTKRKMNGKYEMSN